MRNAVTDFGPTLLVPAAWTVTLATQAGLVARHTVLIALVVMDVLLAAFYLGARTEMAGPVLGLWRRVLLVGFVVTVLGTGDLLVGADSDPLAPLVVAAWMAVPGVAYLLTGRAVELPPYSRVYLAGGALSLAGTLAYLAGTASGVLAGGGLPGTDGTAGLAAVAGITLVGIGQTAGIVAAAVQNA